jgi:hypothetical protein
MTVASNPYEKMTDEEFDEILADIAFPMDVPGVYELVREHYNNAVLDEWLSNQPDEEEDDD